MGPEQLRGLLAGMASVGGLASHASLVALRLGHNTLGSDGIAALAKVGGSDSTDTTSEELCVCVRACV